MTDPIRHGGGDRIDWLRHHHTARIRRWAEERRAVALDALIAAARSTDDPAVIRKVAAYDHWRDLCEILTAKPENIQDE